MLKQLTWTTEVKNGGYGHKYELYEPISWFWRTAEWDLKEQDPDKNKKKCKNKSGKKIEEQVNRTEEDNWTPGIIVLLDFFYITGMPIDRKNNFRTAAVKRREKVEESGGRIIKKRTTEEITPMRETSTKGLEVYFKTASRNMWNILQMEEMSEAIHKKQLSRFELDFIK